MHGLNVNLEANNGKLKFNTRQPANPPVTGFCPRRALVRRWGPPGHLLPSERFDAVN